MSKINLPLYLFRINYYIIEYNLKSIIKSKKPQTFSKKEENCFGYEL